MFENLSVRSLVLIGAAAVAVVATGVPVFVDCRQAEPALEECCCEGECCCEELADPTAI